MINNPQNGSTPSKNGDRKKQQEDQQRVHEEPLTGQLKKLDPSLEEASFSSAPVDRDTLLRSAKSMPDPLPIHSGFGELGEFDQGLFPGMDKNLNRSRIQPTSSKVLRTAGNVIPNIGLSLVEYAGYGAELIKYAGKELAGEDYQMDFSNAMTSVAESNKNPFGEAYRRAPDKVFDLGDPAWWLQNGAGLVESMGSFLIAGAGVGKLALGATGRMAKAISTGMGPTGSKLLAKGARATGQGFTSATLAAFEAGMSGAMVYEQVREEHYRRTGNAAEAEQEASAASAKAFLVSAGLVTALNFTSLYPIFQTTNNLRRASKWNLPRKPGESNAAFASRMAKAGKDPEAPIRSLYDRMGIYLEAGQESAQEVSNIFAEEVGLQTAGMGEHEKTGGDLWLEMLTTEEGILGAILGGVGGAGQTAGMRNLPMHRRAVRDEEGNILQDKNGKAVTQLLSAKQLERLDEGDAGASYAKALEDDVRAVMDAQQRLEKALQEGNDVAAAEARHDLFDVSARRSIPIDGGRALQASIEEVMGIDNTQDIIQGLRDEVIRLDNQHQELAEEGAPDDILKELDKQIFDLQKQEVDLIDKFPDEKVITQAMSMGLSDSVQDNEYKETARQKIKEIDGIRKDYIRTLSRYDFGDEQTAGLGEYVFDLKQRRDRARANIDRINGILAQYEAEVDGIANDLLPEALRESVESPSALVRLFIEREALTDNIKELNEEFKEAKKGNLHIQKKYGQLNKEDAVKAIREQIKKTRSERDAIDSTLVENQEGLAEEYAGTLTDRTAYQQGIAQKKRQEKMLNDLSRRVGFVQSGKGRKDTTKRLLDARTSEIEKQEKLAEAVEKKQAEKEQKKDIQEAKEKKKSGKKGKKKPASDGEGASTASTSFGLPDDSDASDSKDPRPSPPDPQDEGSGRTEGPRPKPPTKGKPDTEPGSASRSFGDFGDSQPTSEAEIEKKRNEELEPLLKEKARIEKEIEDLQDDNLQGAYRPDAKSANGRWNQAYNTLYSRVQGHPKAKLIFTRLLAGNNYSFANQVKYINKKTDLNLEYDAVLKRADDMTKEEFDAAVESYNESFKEIVAEEKGSLDQSLKDRNLSKNTKYPLSDLVNEFPLEGVQKEVYNIIQAVAGRLNVSITFVTERSISTVNSGQDAAFNPTTGEIFIHAETISNGRIQEVLVHEAIHALTYKVIESRRSGQTENLTERQIKAVDGLFELYYTFRGEYDGWGYPVKDIHEFIAHLTNENFVKHLESKGRNFLERVVDFIADLIGIYDANDLTKKYLKDIISNTDVFADGFSFGEGPAAGSKKNRIRKLRRELAEVQKKIDSVNAKYDSQVEALRSKQESEDDSDTETEDDTDTGDTDDTSGTTEADDEAASMGKDSKNKEPLGDGETRNPDVEEVHELLDLIEEARRIKLKSDDPNFKPKGKEGYKIVTGRRRPFKEKVENGKLVRIPISDERIEPEYPRVDSIEKDLVGEEMNLSVDTKYKEKGREVLDEDGNPTSEIPTDPYNIPMIVTDSEGNEVGYLPTVTWLSRKDDNGNYVNVLDYDLNSGESNADVQIATLKKIREKVFKGDVTTVVESRNIGIPIYNRNASGARIRKSAAEALPDKSIQFHVVKHGTVNGQTTYAQEGAIFADLNHPTPMWIDGISPDHMNLFKRALLVRFTGDDAEIARFNELVEQIEDSFDFTATEGLPNLLDRLTYSRRFDVDDVMNAPSDKYFFFANRKSGHIFIGRGNDAIYTTSSKMVEQNPDHYLPIVIPGAKEGEFIIEPEAIRFFSNLTSQISSKRLNSDKPYIDITVNENNELDVVTYETYNDYAKAKMSTYIDGTNTIEHSDGSTEYLYNEQNTNILDVSRILEDDAPLDMTEREAQMFEYLTEDEKRIARKITDPKARLRWITNEVRTKPPITGEGKTIRIAGGTLLSIYKAEDVIADPNSTLKEIAVARYVLKNRGGEFEANLAALNDALKKNRKTRLWEVYDDVLREYYSEADTAFGKSTELVKYGTRDDYREYVDTMSPENMGSPEDVADFEEYMQTEEGEPSGNALQKGIDTAFERAPELEDIGTREQYAAYLATIFPESSTQEIVYHGRATRRGELDLQEGDLYKEEGTEIFFTPDIDTADAFGVITPMTEDMDVTVSGRSLEGEEKAEFIKKHNAVTIYPAILNNPEKSVVENEFKEMNPDKLTDKDTWVEYVVKNPSDVHLLGTQADVQGFRDFVRGDQDTETETSPDSYIYDSEYDDFTNEGTRGYKRFRLAKRGPNNSKVYGIVYGKPVSIEGYEEFDFFLTKDEDGGDLKWGLHEKSTGRSILSGRTIKETVAKFKDIANIETLREQIEEFGNIYPEETQERDDIPDDIPEEFREFYRPPEGRKTIRNVEDKNDTSNRYADNDSDELAFSAPRSASRIAQFTERHEVPGLSPVQVQLAVENIVTLLGDEIISTDLQVTVEDALASAKEHFEGEFSLYVDQGNMEKAGNFSKVLRNWDRLAQKALIDLETIGYTIDNSELEGEDSDYERTKYDARSRWYRSNKDTASANLKLFLSTVPTQSYKTPQHDTYEGDITELADDEIFVFGSNPEGHHGRGAARDARKFGAKRKVGRGLQGQTYALVTKNLKVGFTEDVTGITYPVAGERSVSKKQIIENIRELYEVAKQNPDKKFKVAYMEDGNKNLNGYTNQELADMFSSYVIPENMVFEKGFAELLDPSSLYRELIKERSEFLGLQTYIPIDDLWEKLSSALANQEPNFDNYMDVLKKAGKGYAPFVAVVEKLERLSNESTLKDEFMKALSNQYHDMVVAIIQPYYDEDTGLIDGWNYKPINSDRSSAVRMVFDEWVENAKNDSPFVKEVDGELIMDGEAVEAYKENFIKELEEGGPGVRNVRRLVKQLLKDLGVKLQPTTWEDVLRTNAFIFSDNASITDAFRVQNGRPRANSFLDILFRGFNGGSFDQNNPLTNGELTKRFNKIAFREYLNSDKIITNSFRDVNGNVIHPYQMHTQASDKLRKLQNSDEFRKDLESISFSKDAYWLKHKDLIGLEFVDGISNQLTKNKTSGEALGAVDTDLLSAIMYFGTVAQTKGTSGRYQSTTKADKTNFPIWKAPRLTIVTKIENGQIQDITNKPFKERLSRMIQNEFDRIIEFRSNVRKKLKDEKLDIGDYAEGADKFILFPELNAELAREYIGTAITQEEYNRVWETGEPFYVKEKEGLPSSLAIMTKVVTARLVNESNELLNTWKETGIVTEIAADMPVEGTKQLTEGETRSTPEVVGHMLDNSYMNYHNKYTKMENAVAYAAADFTVNQFIASVNEFQIISGDPANYWKKSKKGGLNEDLKATMENINKRLAGDIAPKSKGRYDSPLFSMIGMNDPVVHARERAKLGKAYEFMEIADAQEYTTVKEHLANMRAEGIISPAEYERLMAKVKPGEYYEFTKEEMRTIFTPTKPLYRGYKHMGSYDVNLEFYTKSSAFPLLPQMLDGFELDKLRKAMETYVDKDRGINGIDRASFGTANKLAMINPVDVFDGRNIKKKIDVSKSVAHLPRDGFGFQQDVPVKNKQEINLVSQANKLLFNGLRNLEGFSFEGKNDLTGRTLENIKQKIRNTLLIRAEKELAEELGIGVDANGDMLINDYTKIKDVLKREAKDRGWSIAAIDSIELNDDRTGFIIPLGLSPNSKAIESLILAQISNITRKQSMHGYSYVQGSSAGLIKYQDFKPKENGFVPTSDFSGDGLKFIRQEGGKTLPAEIIIPWNFRDNNGNLLDMNDFMTDGVIDDEKLPPEAREIIGMRIPNQGHSSMIPLKVVGYIHPNTNLAIVPEEIVAQMGSDFDVDKLYTYQPKIKYRESDGVLYKDDRTLDSFDKPPTIVPLPENIELEGNNFLNMMMANTGTQSMFIGKMTLLGLNQHLVAQLKGEPSTAVHKQLKELLTEYSDQKVTLHMDDVIASVKEAFSEGMNLIPESYNPEDVYVPQNDYENVPTDLLKNKYIDIFWSVMQHEEMYDKLKSPLEKPDLETEKQNILSKTNQNELRSPASYIGQRNYKINQKSAQKLIGIFALANTLNSVIQDTQRTNLNLHTQRVVNRQKINVPHSIKVRVKIDGKDVDLDLSTLSGEGVSYYDGELRSKGDNISLALSAAVDNANVNILGHLNWNEDTAGVVTAMLLLQTPDTKDKKGDALSLGYVSKFTSQPIVNAIVQESSRLQSSAQTDIIIDPLKQAVKRMKQGIEEIAEEREISFTDPVISEGDLDNMIGKDITQMTDQEIDAQYKVLQMFEAFYEIQEDIRQVQQVFLSPDTKGIDTRVIQSLRKVKDYKDILEKGLDTFGGIEGMLTLTDGSPSEQAVSAQIIYGNTEKLINELMPEYTDVYSKIVDTMQVELNRNFSDQKLTDIWNGTKRFLNSFIEELDTEESIELLYERLLFGNEEMPDIATRVREAKNSWGKNNDFLTRVQVETATEKGRPSLLSFKASKAIRLDDSKNVFALAYMFESENEEEAKLGQDLVLYSLITGGVQGANEFIKYVPPSYLYDMGISRAYAEAIAQDLYIQAVPQIIMHNPTLAYNVSTQSDDVVDFMREGGKLKGVVLRAPTPQKSGLAYYVDGEESYPDYISMYDVSSEEVRAFKYKGVTKDGDYIFHKMPKLGYSFVSEYRAGEFITSSDLNADDHFTATAAGLVHKPDGGTNQEPSQMAILRDMFPGETVTESTYNDKFVAVIDKDIQGVLDIYEDKIDSRHLQLIKAIMESAGNVRIHLGDFGYPESSPATYSQTKHTIRIDVANISDKFISESLAHEIVHAVTANAIKNPDIDTSSLVTLYNMAHRLLGEENFPSELETVVEFVAYALTRKSFQEELNNIEFNKNMSLYERFKQIVKDIVEGIAKAAGFDVKKGSILVETINQVVNLADNYSTNIDENNRVTSSRNIDESNTASSVFGDFGDLVPDNKPDSAPAKDRTTEPPPPSDEDRRGEDGTDVASSSFGWDELPVSFDKMEPAIKAVIKETQSRRSAIKARISSTEDEGLKVQLGKALDRLQADIQNLVEKNSAEAIKDVARSQAAFVEGIAANQKFSFSMFETARKVAASWNLDITENFLTRGQTRTDNPIRKAFIEAQSIMSIPKQNLERTTYIKFAKAVNQRLPEGTTVQVSDLKSMEDINLPTKFFFDLSQVNNFLAKYMFEKVTTYANNADLELNEFDERLSDLSGKLTDSDWEGLQQTFEDGTPTGEVIDEYSYEYNWRTRNYRKELDKKLREAESDDKKVAALAKREAFQDFHKKMNAIQETVDIRMLMFDKFASPIWDSRKEYIDYLKDEYGDGKAEEMIESAKIKYTNYLSRRKEQRDIFESEYEIQAIEDVSKDEWIEGQMEEWEDIHSPLKYLDDRFGVIGQATSQFTATAGQKFTTAVPRKTDSKGNDLNLYDPKFQNLNERQKEFYEFYINAIQTFTNYLPNYHARNITRNFLPRIRKSIIETYTTQSMSEAVKLLNHRFTDSLTTGEVTELKEASHKSFQEFDPETGKPKKNIKVLYTGDNVDIADRSFDLPSVLRMYGAMALNYKWMSSIEDEMNLGLNIIRNARGVEKTGGVPVVKGDGSPVEIKNGVPNLTESTAYMLDGLMYGEVREEGKASKITMFDSWNMAENMRKRRQMKELEMRRDELEEELQANLISAEDYEDQMSNLEQKYRALGGKNLVWTKALDWALKVTQLKGMGYNFTAGIANVGFGVLSNLTWAAGNMDFNGKDLWFAWREIIRGIFTGNLKTARIVKNHNVLFEVNEIEYGKAGNRGKRSKKKVYNFIGDKFHPFYIQRMTEFSVQGTSLIAQMRRQPITVTNKETGKEETLTYYDMFGEDGKWKEKYEQPDEWKVPTDPNKGHNEFTKFRNRVIQLNKYLHGNYDPKSLVPIKKTTLGRMVMNFRSWIPYGFQQRIAEEQYDQQLGRNFKGRYRTLYDIGAMKSIKGIFGSIFHADEYAYGKKGTNERLKDIDIANIKMALREMQVVVAIVAAQVMLKGMLDEDDDDSIGSYTAHILINQLYRVEQDVYFYLSPRTFEEIIQNPIPTMQTYTDFQRAIDSSFRYLTETEYEGERALLNWGRSMPVTNQLIKGQYLGTNIIE